MSSLVELVPLSSLYSTSLLICGVTSLVLTSLLVTPVSAGPGLLRRLPSFARLSQSSPEPSPEVERVILPPSSPALSRTSSSLSMDESEGGMKRTSSLVRLESAALGELPPLVRSAVSRASCRL